MDWKPDALWTLIGVLVVIFIGSGGLWNIASILYGKRRYGLALSLYRLLSLHPQRASQCMARAYIGCCLAEMGRYEDAFSVVEKVAPQLVEYRLTHVESFVRETIGRTLSTLGRYDDAERELRRAIYISELGTEVGNAVRLDMAWVMICQHRYDEALAVCGNLLSVKQNTSSVAQVRCIRAEALIGLERHDEALEELHEVARMDVVSEEREWIEFEVWSNCAIVLLSQDRFDEALLACDKLLKVCPRDADQLAQARCLHVSALNHLERFDDALIELDDMERLEVSPKNRQWLAFTVWSHRAFAMLEQQRFGEVLSACERLLEITTQIPDQCVQAHSLRANALIWLGRFDEAFKELEEVESIQVSPEERCYIDATVLGNRTIASCLTGDYQSALEAIERLITTARSPNEKASALLFRAEALAGLGKIDEAEIEYHKALSMAPLKTSTQNQACIIAGIIAEARDEKEKAAEHYRRAAALVPSDVEPRYRLGRLLAPSQPDEARRWLTEAVEVNPHSYYGQLAQQALERLAQRPDGENV